MPVKRKVGLMRRTLDPLAAEHLQSGSDHLLAGECWVCSRGIESARSVWEASRDEIMADWNRLAFPFPPLAAILFDGARFPPELNPQWRDLHRFVWQGIADELVMLAPFDVRRVGGNA